MQHTTVLLHEAVEGLRIGPNDIIVDATFGSGGHAREIATLLDSDGLYIGIDADASALQPDVVKEKIGEVHCKVALINDNFKNLTNILSSLQHETVNGVLADLGWRMEQFADGAKGFSFQHDGPLHMTFGEPSDYLFTAEDIVNEWEEENIADILYGYADERFSRRIAKGIVEARQHGRIKTTFQLVDIIERSVPKVILHKRLHPATKTFQALRITVNDELTVLQQFIKDGFAALKPSGRLAIITFHSIEDRVVKHSFRELAQSGHGVLITKKPISPSGEELAANPRSRSAKLRIIQKYP
jgi:16S rRNA (cytosine1402-N4)-methyltransferase